MGVLCPYGHVAKRISISLIVAPSCFRKPNIVPSWQHVKALTEDDKLFLFYAGHGFSKYGHNYITCPDTDLDDLADTSISLQRITEEFFNLITARLTVVVGLLIP